MMYSDIKKQIDTEFDNYLTQLLQIKGNPRMYFYWTSDFFRIIGGLSFQYFVLTDEQKNEINNIGRSYFQSDDIYFEINKNSHRHDLLIRNISRFFDTTVSNQQKRYEYIKEFILWKIFEELKDEPVSSEIINQQKNNFLITYVNYLLEFTNNPTFKPFANYKKFNLSKKGELLKKRLDSIDQKDFDDSNNSTGETQDLNSALREKTNNLYVLKSYENKIHFVFSHKSDEGKEELRELLDIMGKEGSENLYRGQANSSWVLDASITRESKYRDNEADMYYDILSLKPDAFQSDNSVYERLITMQHFGMPTRLLDVTRNPLVAIFFACNNWECKDEDGVIYIFKKPNKKDFLNFEDDRLKDYLPTLFNQYKKEIDEKKAADFLANIWFIKGVAKNQRINNQSGDFIFVGKGNEVKKDLYKLPQQIIIIDAHTKKVLLEQLESLNIHGGAVYPDLTHMSNYIRKKYANGATVEKTEITITEVIETEEKKDEATPIKTTNTQKAKEQTFDFNTIKGKSKEEQISTFSNFFNLEEEGLEKIIGDILFTEKRPLRDEIVKIKNDKISILKEKGKIDLIIDDIITLAKLVSEE